MKLLNEFKWTYYVIVLQHEKWKKSVQNFSYSLCTHCTPNVMSFVPLVQNSTLVMMMNRRNFVGGQIDLILNIYDTIIKLCWHINFIPKIYEIGSQIRFSTNVEFIRYFGRINNSYFPFTVQHFGSSQMFFLPICFQYYGKKYLFGITNQINTKKIGLTILPA